MRFRVRFQDPGRTTENLIECETLDQAYIARNAIMRYADYLVTVSLPICTIEYRASDSYSESAWKPIPKGKTSRTMKEAADEFVRTITAHLN